MKTILFLLSFVCFCEVQGQKINQCAYKKVDTVIQYKNAITIGYINKKGKYVTDTIFTSKRKCDLDIDEVNVLIVDEDKVLKRKL